MYKAKSSVNNILSHKKSRLLVFGKQISTEINQSKTFKIFHPPQIFDAAFVRPGCNAQIRNNLYFNQFLL